MLWRKQNFYFRRFSLFLEVGMDYFAGTSYLQSFPKSRTRFLLLKLLQVKLNKLLFISIFVCYPKEHFQLLFQYADGQGL